MTKLNPELRYIYKRLLIDFIIKNKVLVLGYTFLILFTYPLITIGSSKLFANLVDSLNTKISFKKDPWNSTYGIILSLIVLMILTSIIYIFQYYLERILFPAYVKYIGVTLRKGAILSRVENLEKIKIGEFLSAMNKTIENFELLMYQVWNKMIPLFLTVIVINGFYYYLNFRLGLMMSSIELFRVIALMYNGSNYRRVNSIKYGKFYDISENFANTFENSFNISINNEMTTETKKQEEIADEYNVLLDQEMDSKSKYMTYSYLIGITSFIFKFFYSYNLYLNKEISKDQMITITFIEGRMIQTWSELDFIFLNIFRIFGNIDSGKDIIYKCLIENESCDPNQAVSNGQIKIKNITYKDILKVDDLNFENNNNYLIKGESGSGKSTLMNLIMRMLPLSNGKITIGDSNLVDLCVQSLRNIVTFVPQENILFKDLSILENLKYGNKLSDETIMNIVKEYDFFPQKNIQEFIYNGNNLSVGLKRRIIVLRGIFRGMNERCKIVIFDEPFASLDADMKFNLLKLMNEKLNRQKTIIVIEHTIYTNNDDTEINVLDGIEDNDFTFNIKDMTKINVNFKKKKILD